MSSSQRFRINRPSVIHEILDDELVIVNLKSGSYYSLDRVGAVIWHEIDAGATEGEVAAVLQGAFEGDVGAMERAAAELIEELQREDLIQPGGANGTAPHREPADDPASVRVAFVAPVLHKYTDMQDLLLLDPIHEVDEAGWPARKG
jgi:hypothetical protein